MSHYLIERAKTEGSPLIDGSQVIFVWEGEAAPAVSAEFNSWDASQAQMAPIGESAWSFTLELPEDAYIEYAFVFGQNRVLDPYNPHHSPNGLGAINQYFYMPQARPSDFALRKPGVARGEVFSLEDRKSVV
jgi:hypothetical protein